MRHIQSRWINEGGITGDFLPSDYGVFLNVPELAHVSSFWEALVTHAQTVDNGAASLAMQLGKSNTGDPEYSAWIEEQEENASKAHFYLTRASLLSLIAGFVEFSLLESYLLVFGTYPLKDKPSIKEKVIKPIEKQIGSIHVPELYKRIMVDSRDTIRNALQHGRWMQLKEESDKIDIHDAFLGVVAYAYELESALRDAGKIK